LVGGILFHFNSIGNRPETDDAYARVNLYSHNPLAIRANPGWSVAYSPFIFIKTFRTDLKPAGAIPAKRFLFATAAADILAQPATAISLFFIFFHF
jgi:hypothetical protein